MLRFRGSQQLRQRLVLATLTGRTIRIDAIRDGSGGSGGGGGGGDDGGPRGLRPHEASLLRLIEKISSGCVVEINETGTRLRYKPGVLVGGAGVTHDCSGTGRALGYFLEPLLLLALFAKRPLAATLRGVTNGPLDPSVDAVRNVTLPLVRRLAGLADGSAAAAGPIGGAGAATGPNALELKVVSRGAPPLGGGEVLLRVPVVRCLAGVGGDGAMTDEGMVGRVRGVAYCARVSPQAANRAVDGARGVLNALLADVYVFTDAASGGASGRSPGFGVTLVAETTSGCLVSAEACAAAPRKGGAGAAAAAEADAAREAAKRRRQEEEEEEEEAQGGRFGGSGGKRRRRGAQEEEEEEEEEEEQQQQQQDDGGDDDESAAAAKAPTSAREAQRRLLRAQDALVVPEDVGATAARRLLEEVSRGGVVDGAHQPLLLTMAALAGPRGALQAVRLGPLTPPAVRALRDLRDFLGVVYAMRPEPKSRTVVLSCVGAGLANANRKAT
jgi:RNA 3'-terminal phosphate cyclase-like protein